MKKLSLFMVGFIALFVASCASEAGAMSPYSGVWQTPEPVQGDSVFLQMEIGTFGKAVVGYYDSYTNQYRSQANMTYEFNEFTREITLTDVVDLTKAPFTETVLPGEFGLNEKGMLTLTLQDGESSVVFQFVKKFQRDMTNQEVVIDKMISMAAFDMDSAYIFETTGGKLYGVYAIGNHVTIATPTDTYSLIKDLAPRGVLYGYGDHKFWFKPDGTAEYTIDEKTYKGELIPLEDYVRENPISFPIK